MKHRMGLYETPFRSIQKTAKVFEVRLNDEKRRNIKVGDRIEFVLVPTKDELLEVEVLELREYPTFEDMYQDIPYDLFDCKGWTLEELVESTYEIYTKEQEKKWGALAIRIKVLT
ncbi:ASCH domain-containing protein [Alkalicoccobacillus porphyridii]|uniref:ASCH domain-containing protein n=1 Tax=Alkalicoccobacillus porphyridii TaxID=2597270 RepID=A0A554A235_9BACI|nr:ASCH domain-containing protein [Alkalicoccobacillus porphyridii]TSB47748.1 ASCH domain-containing protein [Alkalicoccobacillus porphyridii]